MGGCFSQPEPIGLPTTTLSPFATDPSQHGGSRHGGSKHGGSKYYANGVGDGQQQQQQQHDPVLIKASQLERGDASAAGARGSLEAATSIGALNLNRHSTATRTTQFQLQMLGDAHGLQHEMAAVNDNPLLGLQEAAELLTEHLRVDLVA